MVRWLTSYLVMEKGDIFQPKKNSQIYWEETECLDQVFTNWEFRIAWLLKQGILYTIKKLVRSLSINHCPNNMLLLVGSDGSNSNLQESTTCSSGFLKIPISQKTSNSEIMHYRFFWNLLTIIMLLQLIVFPNTL